MRRTVRKKRGSVFGVRMLAAGIFAIMSSLALADRAQAQCRYEVQAIVSAPFCDPSDQGTMTPTAINDHGVVVGWFQPCPLGPRLPFMWSEETGGVAIPLPPGVPDALPMDINNHGEIVGYMGADLGASRGFIWKDGVWTELPLLSGLPEAHANAINDAGKIAGRCFNPFTGPSVAVIWQGGIVTAPSLPIGPNSYAMGVNNDSSIVGLMGGSLTTTSLGFRHNDGDTVDIHPLTGTTSSEGRIVNSTDTVAGRSRTSPMGGQPVPTRSWVFDDNEPIDLGDFPDNIRTSVNDMNDAKQVVGYSSNGTEGNRIPFLWQDGTLHDLRTLIDELPEELFPGSAEAINNVGQVAVSDLSGHFMIILRPKDRPLGDINIDCVVDERDLIAVLEGWGPDRLGHIADIVASSNLQPPGDGKVDGADLAVVLGNWSPQQNINPPDQGNIRR